jgi:IS5 family transposase
MLNIIGEINTVRQEIETTKDEVMEHELEREILFEQNCKLKEELDGAEKSNLLLSSKNCIVKSGVQLDTEAIFKDFRNDLEDLK